MIQFTSSRPNNINWALNVSLVCILVIMELNLFAKKDKRILLSVKWMNQSGLTILHQNSSSLFSFISNKLFILKNHYSFFIVKLRNWHLVWKLVFRKRKSRLAFNHRYHMFIFVYIFWMNKIGRLSRYNFIGVCISVILLHQLVQKSDFLTFSTRSFSLFVSLSSFSYCSSSSVNSDFNRWVRLLFLISFAVASSLRQIVSVWPKGSKLRINILNYVNEWHLVSCSSSRHIGWRSNFPYILV